jgi:ribosomal protein L18E
MALTQLERIIANEVSEYGKREQIKSILAVDVKKADSLISNALAKNLLHKSEEIIFTTGNKRAVVNIDTLNKYFNSGDRIDINVLKDKKLVSKDAGYLKVLSRGQIDKPLTVYASDFSISAVKMIALTGGEAIKCSYKQEKTPEAKYKEQKNS